MEHRGQGMEHFGRGMEQTCHGMFHLGQRMEHFGRAMEQTCHVAEQDGHAMEHTCHGMEHLVAGLLRPLAMTEHPRASFSPRVGLPGRGAALVFRRRRFFRTSSSHASREAWARAFSVRIARPEAIASPAAAKASA